MDTKTYFEDGKLIVTRIYDAPQELVFEAWIETSKVQQWWGCAECTHVRSEIEPRVGGKYNHHMTIEGAGEVPGYGTLVEYDPPNKLAYESGLPHDADAKMRVQVEFTPVDTGTRVRLEHSGIPNLRVAGDCEMREIVRAGWTAAFGKLEALFQPESPEII